jgi:hypothetical protein
VSCIVACSVACSNRILSIAQGGPICSSSQSQQYSVSAEQENCSYQQDLFVPHLRQTSDHYYSENSTLQKHDSNLRGLMIMVI